MHHDGRNLSNPEDTDMATSAAAATDTPPVLAEVDDDVATVTLNRPDKYNALSSAMIDALTEALEALGRNDAVRVIVIGARGRAFSAGHDLKEMRAIDAPADHQALFDRCGRMMKTINAVPQPVIARVQGIATAAGCRSSPSPGSTSVCSVPRRPCRCHARYRPSARCRCCSPAISSTHSPPPPGRW